MPGMPPMFGIPPPRDCFGGRRLPFLPFRPLGFFFVALRPPPRPIWFAICPIIFFASKNRSMSWLTSVTVTPEPLAIRRRRDAFKIFGLFRSSGVMPRIIACTRSNCFSSIMSAIADICEPPGSIFSRLAMGPIFRIINI